MKRRTFLQAGLTAGAALVFHSSFAIHQASKAVGEIIGHGDFKYRVNRNWGVLDSSKYPVNDCHEMVMDSRKRLIMLTNETRNNLLVYDKSGKLLEAFGNQFPGGHGLTLHNENGTEYLYITDINLDAVYKTTLKGEVLLTIKHPKFIGEYRECDKFKPTETCIGPAGDIYVADGYGSQFILQYSPKGEFVRKFGGDSYQPHQFKQAHGVALDTRQKDNPVLMCTDRMKNCFKRFTLDGTYLDSIHVPGAYMSRPVFDDDILYSGVCFSARDHHMLTYNAGFVTILNGNNKVVSNPGGTKPRYKNGEPGLMVQEKPIFKHCHDVCVDDDKNLYICQWNANKTYPIKLERI